MCALFCMHMRGGGGDGSREQFIHIRADIIHAWLSEARPVIRAWNPKPQPGLAGESASGMLSRPKASSASGPGAAAADGNDKAAAAPPGEKPRAVKDAWDPKKRQPLHEAVRPTQSKHSRHHQVVKPGPPQ
jgi:hypothetical protein